jgi:hypothetical protein
MCENLRLVEISRYLLFPLETIITIKIIWNRIIIVIFQYGRLKYPLLLDR